MQNKKGIEERLITQLKKGKFTLEELADHVHLKQNEVRDYLERIGGKGVPIQTTGRTKKPLYFIQTLPESGNVYTISENGSHKLDFVATSDWHIASVFHLPRTFHDAMKKTLDAGIENVFVAGDLMDGIGIYKGHHENVVTPSIEGQTDMVAEAIAKYPTLRFWGISGNHDYSFTQQNGAKPLSILEAKVDNFKNLGDLRADVVIDGIRIRLLHGAGGRNYARSYPSQTYLRDFFGGLEREQLKDIPHVMVIGHYHTYYDGKDHGIFILQPGSFQDGDNEYCVRRGLTGPAGLFHVRAYHEKGHIILWQTTYVQPKVAMEEKGKAFAKTTKNYGER